MEDMFTIPEMAAILQEKYRDYPETTPVAINTDLTGLCFDMAPGMPTSFVCAQLDAAMWVQQDVFASPSKNENLPYHVHIVAGIDEETDGFIWDSVGCVGM
jgi:hypothetical protein